MQSYINSDSEEEINNTHIIHNPLGIKKGKISRK